MAGDAVREALEAAVTASLAHDGEDVPPPLHARNQRRWRVAHEVAAFLRALPAGWHMDKARDVMAAAVERIAKEADNAK